MTSMPGMDMTSIQMNELGRTVSVAGLVIISRLEHMVRPSSQYHLFAIHGYEFGSRSNCLHLLHRCPSRAATSAPLSPIVVARRRPSVICNRPPGERREQPDDPRISRVILISLVSVPGLLFSTFIRSLLSGGYIPTSTADPESLPPWTLATRAFPTLFAT